MNSHDYPAGDERRPGADATHQPALPAGQDGGSQPDEGHPATAGDAGGPSAGGRGGPSGGPSGPSAGGPAPQPAPTSTERFFSWLRGLGVTRGQDRWVGGVASGVAQRIGIDPVIVRGLLVVFAIFGGIGVLAYGLAWAFLPEPDGRIHAEGAARGHWSDGMTGALIVTILGFIQPFGGFWEVSWGFGSALWTLLWVGGLVALGVWLFSSRKQQRHAGPGPATAAGAGPAAAEYPAYTVPGAPARGTEQPRTDSEPGWQSTPTAEYPMTPPPLYPEYRYGSENSTPAGNASATARKTTPSAAMVAICAGLALLAGGGLLALHYTNMANLGTHPYSVAAAAAAVVLGASIVVAGALGRSSGTIGFLAIVALLAGGVLNVMPTSNNVVIGSQASWHPGSIDAAESGFSAVAAQGRVTMDSFEARGPLDEEVVVPVNVAMGNMTVVVPEDIPVEIRSNLLFGSLQFDGEGSESSGIWNPSDQTLNADAAGEKIIVDVRGIFSQVTITESANGQE